MSSTWKKIAYVEQGAYGSTERRTMFVENDATSDHVRFYDDRGNLLFSYGEWTGNEDELDLGEAMSNMLTTNHDDQESPTKDELLSIREMIDSSHRHRNNGIKFWPNGGAD